MMDGKFDILIYIFLKVIHAKCPMIFIFYVVCCLLRLSTNGFLGPVFLFLTRHCPEEDKG
jgi:hypothetical protein